MKEFFEEYGRVIVTVLIILGIILVGYVLAGNGRNSALGKFTANVTESLSSQANDVLEKSSLSSWKINNSDAQAALQWDDSITSKKLARSGDYQHYINSSYIDEASPIPGKIHHVSIGEDSNDPGTYSYVNFRKKDGSVIDHLETGKKYKTLYYIRGKGTWQIGFEQGNYKTYNLTDAWQKVSDEFTAGDNEGYHAFAQYRRYGAKAGDWSDVTCVWLSEAD